MKKIIFGALLASTTVLVSAQNVLVCTDLQANLVRGSESKNVLALQNFLYAKGILKATPNGYFGPATTAAVKAYQKSIGLSQVGNTGPVTRAAIKKESCAKNNAVIPAISSSGQSSSTSAASSSALLPSIPAASSTAQATAQYVEPSISSINKGTLFAGGDTTWRVTINGSFSNSSTTVFFTNRGTGKKYTIGSFQSGSSTAVYLPVTLTKDKYSCGTGCDETLPAGDYNVTVRNEGGESKPHFLSIKSFSVSSLTSTLSSPLRQNATSSRFGTVSFAASVPFYISGLAGDVKTERIPLSGVSGIYFKDETTGQIMNKFGADAFVAENQSKIVGVYGNINSTSSGSISFSTLITITDFVGKLPVTFTSPPFVTSASGF